MARMTGGVALVEMLCRHGVDTLFALPGVLILPRHAWVPPSPP